MAFSHWKTNPRIFRAFLDKSAKTIQWLEEKGLTFDNIPPLYQGHTIGTWHSFKNENAGPVILKRLREICQELGVEMVFHCTAKRILTVDKTEVIGVLAEKKGEEMRMNAKNVIIATGGYGGNKELLKKYRPSYTEDMVYLGVPHLKGDGLRMAFEVGAANEGLGTLILHPHFSQGPEAVTGMAQEPSTLWVNKMGERFADEALTFRPTDCGNAIDRQPGKCVYALFDERVKKRVMEEGLLKGDFLDKRPGYAGSKPVTLDKDLKKEAEKGSVKISDSWDEIAGWMGAEPGTLRATIEEYNAFCDRGHDALFEKDRRYLRELRTPPFYAIKCYLCYLTTIGGIKINHHMQVLNDRGQTIPGLYAGGDTTGDWESDTYCIDLSGHAAGFAVNSGRIAGENAAENVLGD